MRKFLTILYTVYCTPETLLLINIGLAACRKLQGLAACSSNSIMGNPYNGVFLLKKTTKAIR